ncbi:MAG: hypothetical protein ACJASC_002031 [Limimaricola cinnabarinus]|jgi:hypothetical protein
MPKLIADRQRKLRPKMGNPVEGGGNAAPLDCPLIPRNERRDDAVPPENTRVAAVYAIEWFRFS